MVLLKAGCGGDSDDLWPGLFVEVVVVVPITALGHVPHAPLA